MLWTGKAPVNKKLDRKKLDGIAVEEEALYCCTLGMPP